MRQAKKPIYIKSGTQMLTLGEILAMFPEEYDRYKNQETPLYVLPNLDRYLYEYFMDEMPYGTAKARTGDPGQWIDTIMERLGLL